MLSMLVRRCLLLMSAVSLTVGHCHRSALRSPFIMPAFCFCVLTEIIESSEAPYTSSIPQVLNVPPIGVLSCFHTHMSIFYCTLLPDTPKNSRLPNNSITHFYRVRTTCGDILARSDSGIKLNMRLIRYICRRYYCVYVLFLEF